MEIILSIFLTLEVKSYLILINIWEIVRILVISEKSDLGTHSAFTILDHKQKYTFIYGHGLHICVSTIVRLMILTY